MKTTTEMQLVPITKLVPYVNNARTHSPEQITKLRSSLREFGFINPVIIDRDFNVIAGHGRILAAKEEGIKEVPCVFADHLTEAQKKAYIRSNTKHNTILLNPTFFTKGFCLIFSTFRPPTSFVPSVLTVSYTHLTLPTKLEV